MTTTMRMDSRDRLQSICQAAMICVAGGIALFYAIPTSFGSLINTRLEHFSACAGPTLHGTGEFWHYLRTGYLDGCMASGNDGAYPYLAWAAIIITVLLVLGFTVGILTTGPIDAFGENIFFGLLIFAVIAVVIALLIIWMIVIAMAFMIGGVLLIGVASVRD